MKSLITGGKTTKLFTARVLGKYDVNYFRCSATGFIQTETPYWLNEAYSDAISDLDVGCVSRNFGLAQQTSYLLGRHFPAARRVLDFGAGYGLFVRLMRDLGYDCHWYDPFCKNLFARGFEADVSSGNKFDIVTAFEVFEHSVDPVRDVERMFEHANTIVFSTLLVPDSDLRSPEDWWYFIPITGQHIAFYTRESLTQIASKFEASFFTNGVGLHLMTRERNLANPFSLLGKLSFRRMLCKFTDNLFPPGLQPSLQINDFEDTYRRLEGGLTCHRAGDTEYLQDAK